MSDRYAFYTKKNSTLFHDKKMLCRTTMMITASSKV